MIPEGRDTATRLVLQEFEVKQGSVAGGEARQDVFPTALVLVAVRELDMSVLEGDYTAVKMLVKSSQQVAGSNKGRTIQSSSGNSFNPITI